MCGINKNNIIFFKIIQDFLLLLAPSAEIPIIFILYFSISFIIIYKAILLEPLPLVYLALFLGYLIILGFPS